MSILLDINVLISRTGYTGEDGFEIYGSPEAIVAFMDGHFRSW